jgi:hypothetical protein
MTNPSINKSTMNFTIIGNNNNVNIGDSNSPLNLTSGVNTEATALHISNADTRNSLPASTGNNTSSLVAYAQTNTQTNTQPYTKIDKSEITKTPPQDAVSPASFTQARVETRTNNNYDQYAGLYKDYIGAYKTSYITAYEKYLATHISSPTSNISQDTRYLSQAPIQHSRPSPQQQHLNSSLTNVSQNLGHYSHPYTPKNYQHNPANYINADFRNHDFMNSRNKYPKVHKNRFPQQNPQSTINQIAHQLSSLTSLVNQLRNNNGSSNNLRHANNSEYSPSHRNPLRNELDHKLNSFLGNKNTYNNAGLNSAYSPYNNSYKNLLANDSTFASNLSNRSNQDAEYNFRGTNGFNNIESGNSNSLVILDADSSGNFINLGNGSSKVDYKNSLGKQDTFLFGGKGKADTFAISGITLKDTLAALSKDYVFVKRDNGFSLINRNTGGEVRTLGFERLEFKDAILDLTTSEGMQALEDGLSDANVEIIDLSNNSSNNSQWDSSSSYLAPSGLARNFGTGNDYGDNSWNDASNNSDFDSNPYSSLASDYSPGLDPHYNSSLNSNAYSDSPYSSLNIPELRGGNCLPGELVGNHKYYGQDNSWDFTNQANPPSSLIAPYYQESYGSNSEYGPPVIVINPGNPVDSIDPNPNIDLNTISLSGTGPNNIVTRNNQPGAPLTINTQPNTGAIINNLFAPANATLASGFNGYIGSSQTQIRGSNTSSDPINGIFHSFGTFGDPTNNSAGTAPIDIDLGSRSNGIPHRIIAVAGAGNINMRGGDLSLLSSRSGGAANPGFTIQDARSVRIGGQLIQQTHDAANRQNIYVDERNQVYRINPEAQVIFVSRDRVNFENTNNNVGIGNPGSTNNQIDVNNFVNQSGQLPHATRVITDGQVLDLAELLPFRPDQAPPVQSQNQPTPRNGQGTATGLNARPVIPAPQFQPQLQNRALVFA